MGSSSGIEEQYCLRWHDFQANVTSAFSEIRDDEDLLDVTLVCPDGHMVRAHKLMLSACSPMFKAMLQRNSHPQPVIFLHGVSHADITAILNFMYHGEVNVTEGEIGSFLAIAEDLKVRGLTHADLQDRMPASLKKMAGVKRSSSSSTDTDLPHLSPKRGSAEMVKTAVNIKAEPSSGSGNAVIVTPDLPTNESDPVRDVSGGIASGSSSKKHLVICESREPKYRNAIHLKNERVRRPSLGEYKSSDDASGGGGVSYHRLGGRDADDPMSTMMVALSHKGWHCPECLHTSTTKGNLKSHILSGRHKLFEKSNPCQYCQRSYSTRQSLQVHISTHHRFERDAEYHKDQQNRQQQGDNSNTAAAAASSSTAASAKNEDLLSTAAAIPTAAASTVSAAAAIATPQVAQIVQAYPQKQQPEVVAAATTAGGGGVAAATAAHPHHQFVNYLNHSMVTNAFATNAAAAAAAVATAGTSGGVGGATVTGGAVGGVPLNYQVSTNEMRLPHNV